jgi:hypothetical protein
MNQSFLTLSSPRLPPPNTIPCAGAPGPWPDDGVMLATWCKTYSHAPWSAPRMPRPLRSLGAGCESRSATFAWMDGVGLLATRKCQSRTTSLSSRPLTNRLPFGVTSMSRRWLGAS